MLSLSFSSFMLLLLIILLFINDTIAHTDKGGNGIAKTGRSHLINVEKEDFDGVTPACRIGGRKRMVERRNMRQSRMKNEGIIGLRNQSKLNGTSSHSDNVKVNRGSFTAFSADYHMPRTHPPKNN